jgi:hypothetical protein
MAYQESFKGMIVQVVGTWLPPFVNHGYSACYCTSNTNDGKLDPNGHRAMIGVNIAANICRLIHIQVNIRGSGAKGGVATALTLRAPSEDCH